MRRVSRQCLSASARSVRPLNGREPGPQHDGRVLLAWAVGVRRGVVAGSGSTSGTRRALARADSVGPIRQAGVGVSCGVEVDQLELVAGAVVAEVTRLVAVGCEVDEVLEGVRADSDDVLGRRRVVSGCW